MELQSNKQKGNAGLALAIAYFETNGYTISLPLNDTQWYDLIIEKNSIFQTVQCKFTSLKDNVINLRNCGGTKGKTYGNTLDTPFDLLFCVTDRKEMFVIPKQSLVEANVKNTISLRKERSIYSNKNSFDTSPFLVQF